MTYLARFADEFKTEWVSLKDARMRYERKVEQLAGYEGKRHDAEMEAAKETYEQEVAAIHAKYDGEVSRWLDAMGRGLSKGAATPPSDEQLRLLQLLRMRERLTEAEVESAAEQLAGNELAMGALVELVNKSGQPLGNALQSHKSVVQRRSEALDVLRDRAVGLSAWGGGDENVTVEPWHRHRETGGTRPRHAFSAAAVARLQDVGTMSTYDLVRALIDGTGAEFNAAAQLD